MEDFLRKNEGEITPQLLTTFNNKLKSLENNSFKIQIFNPDNNIEKDKEYQNIMDLGAP